MTPGARLQSAIEILDEIFRSGRPADRVFDTWSRSSRFAGSKDRTAVSEIVFTVLRRRAELAAACGSDSAPSPRRAPPHDANRSRNRGAADGGRHALAPLAGEGEGAPRCRPARADAPQHVRFNTRHSASRVDAPSAPALKTEMAALLDRAPTDLRVNTLKSFRDKGARRACRGHAAEPCALSPWGIASCARQPAGLALFRDGAIEIQDEGSQLACLLSAVKPGEQVGPLRGRRRQSLALAAMMGTCGQIYACDIDDRRLGGLSPALSAPASAIADPCQPFRPGEPGCKPTRSPRRLRWSMRPVAAGAWRRSPDAAGAHARNAGWPPRRAG